MPVTVAASSVTSHPLATALAREQLEAAALASGAGPSGDPVFTGEETEEGRPVHPESKALFNACGGKMRAIRHFPLFGRAIEAFGYKFVGSLSITEFLSKGIANYSLQYSYQPMFCERFGAGAMEYQRYQNVAMMGWSIKPLIALLSDAFAVFGYTKRYYMVVSAVCGTVCCFVYALLPGVPSSAPIAAALLFLAGLCQANLDILSEGFYSRLMRKIPAAGPALVGSVWWMLSIGSIVAAFIEGPLSDGGKARLAGYIAGACMAATVPFFLLNLFGERTNRTEREEDFAILLEQEKQKLAAAAAVVHDEDQDALVAEGLHLEESLAAAKNAELQGSRELPIGAMTGVGDASQDLVGFSMEHADPHVRQPVHGSDNTPHAGRYVDCAAGLTDAATMNDLSNSFDDVDGAGYAAVVRQPRIRSFCGGAVEYNEEVILRNWRIAVYAAIMTAGVIALAIVTILPGTYPLLFTCVGVVAGVSGISLWALPTVVAKASMFAFLNQMLYVQITGPLNSFYLATPDCLPGGPHFSYFFYNSISSVISSVANMAGVTLFTYVFAKRSYRITFIVTCLFEVVGSIFDLIMVKRWNVVMHIPDHVMYVCGDSVVYQVAYMLNWMPMVVLLSQLCPRGSEAIVYALLAGFSNLGQTMATEIGTLLMDFVWPVVTEPASACNFTNLPILIIVCHLCVPLLQLPLVFFLIPGARVCDELDEDGHVKDKSGHDGHDAHDTLATNDLLTLSTTSSRDNDNHDLQTHAGNNNNNNNNNISNNNRSVSMHSAPRSGTVFGANLSTSSTQLNASRHGHRYQTVSVVVPPTTNAAVDDREPAHATRADPGLIELMGSVTGDDREPTGRGHAHRTSSTAHHQNTNNNNNTNNNTYSGSILVDLATTSGAGGDLRRTRRAAGASAAASKTVAVFTPDAEDEGDAAAAAAALLSPSMPGAPTRSSHEGDVQSGSHTAAAERANAKEDSSLAHPPQRMASTPPLAPASRLPLESCLRLPASPLASDTASLLVVDHESDDGGRDRRKALLPGGLHTPPPQQQQQPPLSVLNNASITPHRDDMRHASQRVADWVVRFSPLPGSSGAGINVRAWGAGEQEEEEEGSDGLPTPWSALNVEDGNPRGDKDAYADDDADAEDDDKEEDRYRSGRADGSGRSPKMLRRQQHAERAAARLDSSRAMTTHGPVPRPPLTAPASPTPTEKERPTTIPQRSAAPHVQGQSLPLHGPLVAIKVSTLSGVTLRLTVDPSMTLAALCRHVAAYLRFPLAQVTLKYLPKDWRMAGAEAEAATPVKEHEKGKEEDTPKAGRQRRRLTADWPRWPLRSLPGFPPPVSEHRDGDKGPSSATARGEEKALFLVILSSSPVAVAGSTPSRVDVGAVSSCNLRAQRQNSHAGRVSGEPTQGVALANVSSKRAEPVASAMKPTSAQQLSPWRSSSMGRQNEEKPEARDAHATHTPPRPPRGHHREDTDEGGREGGGTTAWQQLSPPAPRWMQALVPQLSPVRETKRPRAE